jgi:large subunit ribosomal protein L29
MKAEDLKTKTVDELQKLLLDTRKTQFNVRFQRAGGQFEKTAEIRKTRRIVARIKTFLNAKNNAVGVKEAVKAAPAKAKPKTKKAG